MSEKESHSKTRKNLEDTEKQRKEYEKYIAELEEKEDVRYY